MQPVHLSVLSGKRVHLGVTGSIAAYKALDLLRLLVKTDMTAGATLTGAAGRFVTDLAFASLGADPVYAPLFSDQDLPYAHLEPGQTAQALLIMPATANAIAKMANGLADDMLSCQALSFPGPILVAPSMNPKLWNAAATRENWDRLMARGVIPIGPDCGNVACGETGQGRMATVEQIYLETLRAVVPNDLTGTKILITLGPTREYFDKVRFWSNPSSGKMGWSMALCAWMRGAEVSVVHGPVDLEFPPAITTIPVISAREMFAAAMDLWPAMDIGCCTAAVADFAPEPYVGGKLKKETLDGTLNIRFSQNPDILQTMGQRKGSSQKLIGFAAEAVPDIRELALGKLRRKNLDLIVANRIDLPGSGFTSWENSVTLIDTQNTATSLDGLAKTDIAWRIWDWILRPLTSP